jgi:hypothetical protein
MVLEQKTWLNHALFSGMASFIKRVADRGEIEIMICGGGSLKRTWDDLNKLNQVRQVRTPGSLTSATRPNVRTPYLRLRLPVHICRMQRGEPKPAVNPAELNEYLALPPECPGVYFP